MISAQIPGCNTQVVTAYFGFYTRPAWFNTKRVWRQAPVEVGLLQIWQKIKDCIAISAVLLLLWESPSLHIQCSRLNIPGVCCCIQSYGLITSQRWVEGKVAVPTPGNWCVLCAQGVFVSVRIYRATSLPVPQSILSWPQEISSSSQEHHVILLLFFFFLLLSCRDYFKTVQDFQLS